MTNKNTIAAATARKLAALRAEYKATATRAMSKHAGNGLTVLAFNAHCGHIMDDSDGEIQGTPEDYVAIAEIVLANLDNGRFDPMGPPEWDPGYAAEMQMARVQAR